MSDWCVCVCVFWVCPLSFLSCIELTQGKERSISPCSLSLTGGREREREIRGRNGSEKARGGKKKRKERWHGM